MRTFRGNANALQKRYREMVSDAQREAEAEEWSEGLIGDAFAEEQQMTILKGTHES